MHYFLLSFSGQFLFLWDTISWKLWLNHRISQVWGSIRIAASNSLLLTDHLKLNHVTRMLCSSCFMASSFCIWWMALVVTSVFQPLYWHFSDRCRVGDDVIGMGKIAAWVSHLRDWMHLWKFGGISPQQWGLIHHLVLVLLLWVNMR